MSGHTPGPWHVSKSHNFVRHTLADLTAANICDLSNGSAIQDDEREANARLIAAAPELLSVLRELHAYCVACEWPPSAGDLILGDAERVIAKAEGTPEPVTK